MANAAGQQLAEQEGGLRRLGRGLRRLLHQGQEIRHQRGGVEGLGQRGVDGTLPASLRARQAHHAQARPAIRGRGLAGLLETDQRGGLVAHLVLEEARGEQEQQDLARRFAGQGGARLLEAPRRAGEVAGRRGQTHDFRLGLGIVGTQPQYLEEMAERLLRALGALLLEPRGLALQARLLVVGSGQGQPVRQDREQPLPVVAGGAAAQDTFDREGARRLVVEQREEGVAQALGLRRDGQGAPVPHGAALGIGEMLGTGLAQAHEQADQPLLRGSALARAEVEQRLPLLGIGQEIEAGRPPPRSRRARCRGSCPKPRWPWRRPCAGRARSRPPAAGRRGAG